MKRLFPFIFLLFCLTSQAQKLKIGYVYEDYILKNLPQTKSLQAELATRQQVLETQLKEKEEAYQAKFAVYQESLRDISKITTESLNSQLKEVQEIQQGIKQFRANAEDELRKTAQEKLNNIHEIMSKGEQEVAKEKGFPFVFRRSIEYSNQESRAILLYSSNEANDDLSDAVLIKLGGTPPAKK